MLLGSSPKTGTRPLRRAALSTGRKWKGTSVALNCEMVAPGQWKAEATGVEAAFGRRSGWILPPQPCIRPSKRVDSAAAAVHSTVASTAFCRRIHRIRSSHPTILWLHPPGSTVASTGFCRRIQGRKDAFHLHSVWRASVRSLDASGIAAPYERGARDRGKLDCFTAPLPVPGVPLRADL